MSSSHLSYEYSGVRASSHGWPASCTITHTRRNRTKLTIYQTPDSANQHVRSEDPLNKRQAGRTSQLPSMAHNHQTGIPTRKSRKQASMGPRRWELRQTQHTARRSTRVGRRKWLCSPNDIQELWRKRKEQNRDMDVVITCTYLCLKTISCSLLPGTTTRQSLLRIRFFRQRKVECGSFHR